MASNNVDTAAATAGAASSSRGEGRSTELSHGHNPVTVSSLSSIDTAGYDYNDASINHTNDLYNNDQQQSANPHPLPPLPSNSSTANDHSLPLSQSYMNPDTSLSQQQSLPSQLTSSSGPLMGQTTMRLSPTTRVGVPSAPSVNTVPEFLCSLTKMLTDNNREIIEWSNGTYNQKLLVKFVFERSCEPGSRWLAEVHLRNLVLTLWDCFSSSLVYRRKD